MSLQGSEQAGGDGAGDPSIARRVHVQVIADVVGRVDLPGAGRVADRAVEIEYGVELVTGADPGVDLLAGRLTECRSSPRTRGHMTPAAGREVSSAFCTAGAMTNRTSHRLPAR